MRDRLKKNLETKRSEASDREKKSEPAKAELSSSK
jgi:hypothetical protein